MNHSALARRRPAPNHQRPSNGPERSGIIATGSEAGVAPARSPALRPASPRVDRRPAPAPARVLAPAPAYARNDLLVIGQIAFHYLQNGSVELAKALLEGLVEAAPHHPELQLLYGLTCDHAGDRAAAERAYREAARLDRDDPRAPLNAAEVAIAADRLQEARPLLQEAATRAHKKGDLILHKKARALLRHLDRHL